MSEGGLDPEAKEFIEKRMRRHERLEKAAQVIDVITAMSSLSPDPKRELKSIASGESKAKMDFIVDVVRAYRQQKSGKPITEFFSEGYGDRALVLLKPADAIREAVRGGGTGAGKPKS